MAFLESITDMSLQGKHHPKIWGVKCTQYGTQDWLTQATLQVGGTLKE